MILMNHAMMGAAGQVASGGFNLVSENLVSRWLFDEGTGSSASDSVGSNHLTQSGTVGWYSDAGGTGLNMTEQGYYYAPDSPSLSVTGELTVAIRAKANTGSRASEGLIAKYSGVSPSNSRSYNIAFSNTTGNLVFVVSSDGTFVAAKQVDSARALSEIVFEWVIAVYKPSVSMQMFAEGESIAFDNSGIPSSIHENSSQLWVGAQYDTESTYLFSGQIDEARIYNRALTLSEIAAISAGEG